MSESGHKRAQRVGQLIQETLASLFVDGLKDPRVGFVTITEVRATNDLRTAKVFVSVFGTDEARRASIDGLNDAAGFLRRELAHRLTLRFVPELQFVLDATLDQAERMDALMKAIARGETDVPAPRGPDFSVPVSTERSALVHSAERFAERPEPQRRGPEKGRRHHRRNSR